MGREQQWVDHVIFLATIGTLRCVPCGTDAQLLGGASQLESFLAQHARCEELVSTRRRLIDLLRARSKRPRAPRPALA